MKKIGDLLKTARKESGLTVDQIAVELGFATRSSVYQMEGRDKLDFTLLKKVCTLYNKPISYFVDYVDTPKTDKDELNKSEMAYSKSDKSFVNEIYEKDQKIISLQDKIIDLQREIIDLTKKVKD
ncbi:helix-turn-helix domain-containing protein [Carboxylicivirga marina]|uniref:helix-turn-helix domain-containing protein n=1 Tax=Carboxylicivirga marina TaxID=2800988 RepID=UPI00259A4A19|nr:helix-turn-helix transcriptional regulator [uncultured Carboxylicivirga sp.]